MEKPAISVVVPVYNVEQYINKCIDSILSQSIQNIEIILVDDGSKDTSGAICDQYAMNDSRVKSFHKKNGGLSSARNFGVMHSSADFVTFVDSDDYITVDMCETLLNDLLENHADVSIMSYYNYYESSQKTIAVDIGEKRVMKGVDLLGLSGFVIAVAKLYKKTQLLKNPFREGRLYEDAFFYADFYPNIDVVSINPRPGYYYIHHKNSITSATYNIRQWDQIDAEYEILKATINYNPNNKLLSEARVYSAYGQTADKLIASGITSDKKKEFSNIRHFFTSEFFRIMINPYLSTARKLVTIVEIISPRVSKYIVKIKLSGSIL